MSWEGEFGIEYTKRNVINVGARAEIFKKLLTGVNFSWVLEVGSNKGHNLTAISSFRDCMYLIGLEKNKEVGQSAQRFTVIGDAYSLPFGDNYFNLVYTAGVLIHLPDSLKAMSEIYRVSNKYILSIEYFDKEEREIKYRDGVYCAAKPFDKLWTDNFNVKVVKRGHMSEFGDEGTDFSRACEYILLEK